MKLYDELGTIDEVFQLASGDVKSIIIRLHEHIVGFDKDVHIVPRLGEKSIAYGLGTKKMSEAYCYLMPQKSYVNLGFFHGANLKDPSRILEGTGKKLRHVKIKTVAMAESDEILALITSAKYERLRELG